MSVKYGNLTIHYRAEDAAEGGPIPMGPTIPGGLLTAEEASPVTLLYDAQERRWVIADSHGQIYAESPNPGHLADWLSEYAETLGRMQARGEL